MLKRILSKVVKPQHYLWLRYRLDKYFGWKGMDPIEVLHHFWQHPSRGNDPHAYLPNPKNSARSELLVSYISKYVDKGASILELGCNVGRNIKFLKDAGFSRLSGVEINPQAIEMLFRNFPELLGQTITHSSIENFFQQQRGEEYDLIFSSAVLEHLPRESEWVFRAMSRRTRGLILTFEIEDEDVNFHRIVGRKYRAIFEALGFQCIDSQSFDGGAFHNYTLRVFKKLA